MRFRIGVRMGDVIEKAHGTIYGDGVNIAARLEGLAESGRSGRFERVERGRYTAN
jgi:adenylate cyclase